MSDGSPVHEVYTTRTKNYKNSFTGYSVEAINQGLIYVLTFTDTQHENGGTQIPWGIIWKTKPLLVPPQASLKRWKSDSAQTKQNRSILNELEKKEDWKQSSLSR